MTTTKNWYAVYTRPKCEKKVADLLTRKKIEAYCPVTTVTKQWSDRKKSVQEPLFNSYVFVNIDYKEQIPIKQTLGIINFVYWLGQPAVIKEEEIETIKEFLHQYENVKLEKAVVNCNDRVRITSGPLKYMEGDVLEVRNKTVKVYLPSLGYQLVAEIEKSNIEILPERNAQMRLIS
jgi:transcription antitermination factor NusG